MRTVGETPWALAREPGRGTNRTYVVVHDGGALVEWSGISNAQPRHAGGGVRGAISGFSKAARRRMLRTLSTIKQDSLAEALFVTLTYPGNEVAESERWSVDPAVWKKHLDTFGKRLRRAFPGCSAIWRIDAQRRGAPHFHLLVFGAGFIPHEWCARAWWEIVGSGSADHLSAGTETRAIESPRQAVYYVSKYAGKVSEYAYRTPAGEEIRSTGRQWGIIARKDLPTAHRDVLVVLGERGRRFLLGALYGATGYRKVLDSPVEVGGALFGEVSTADLVQALGRYVLPVGEWRAEKERPFRELVQAFIDSGIEVLTGGKWTAYPNSQVEVEGSTLRQSEGVKYVQERLGCWAVPAG